MYKTVIVCTSSTIFINIHGPAKNDIIRPFKEKYHSKIIELVNSEHQVYTMLTTNVDIGLQTDIPKWWAFTICNIKHVSELLQLFVDETLKAEIIRKAFEYV